MNIETELLVLLSAAFPFTAMAPNYRHNCVLVRFKTSLRKLTLWLIHLQTKKSIILGRILAEPVIANRERFASMHLPDKESYEFGAHVTSFHSAEHHESEKHNRSVVNY